MKEIILPTMTDFPKLECPFIRKDYKRVIENGAVIFQPAPGQHDHFNREILYLVTPEVNPGFEWVFEDSETIAIEKLNGTNVKINVENRRITAVQNRLNVIDLYQINTGKMHFAEGIMVSAGLGHLPNDGEISGELLGPKVQGNPYKLLIHEFYPFDKTIDSLRYKSFHNYERTFDNWSGWFKDHLFSMFYSKKHKVPHTESIMAEGVIFYNLKRKAEQKSWRAKLRRDMFDWFYVEGNKPAPAE